MRFNYLEPSTVEEAISMLGGYDGRAKLIAGGTDLIVQIRDKLVSPEYVIDITYIPGLDYIEYNEKQGLRIGALTTIREIEKSDVICKIHPVISQAAGLLGSVAIRNVATIGGNLSNAAPSADTAPSLIGLGAKAKIVGKSGEKTIALDEFFTGPGCIVCGPGEILVEIQVPVSSPNVKGAYFKHSRSAVDLATVGVAAIMDLDAGNICRDVKIVLGAVAPTPMRAKKAEEILKGQKVEPALIEKTAEMAAAESQPITDVRASAEYRNQRFYQ